MTHKKFPNLKMEYPHLAKNELNLAKSRNSILSFGILLFLKLKNLTIKVSRGCEHSFYIECRRKCVNLR